MPKSPSSVCLGPFWPSEVLGYPGVDRLALPVFPGHRAILALTAAVALQPSRPSEGSASSPATQTVEARARAAGAGWLASDRVCRSCEQAPQAPSASSRAAAPAASPPRKDLEGRVWLWPLFGGAVVSIHLFLVWPHASSLFSLHACACAVFPTKILFPLPCLTPPFLPPRSSPSSLC